MNKKIDKIIDIETVGLGLLSLGSMVTSIIWVVDKLIS